MKTLVTNIISIIKKNIVDCFPHFASSVYFLLTSQFFLNKWIKFSCGNVVWLKVKNCLVSASQEMGSTEKNGK